jgi:hypothetical protein
MLRNRIPVLFGRRAKLSVFNILMDFEYQTFRGVTASGLTCSRGQSTGTNVIWTDPPGFTKVVSLANTLRFRSGTSLNGLLIDIGPKVNSLASTTPTGGTNVDVAVTAGSNYTLWINAEANGSAALTATTATISGTGTATHGVPIYFSCTVSGNVNVAFTGTIYLAQLENTQYPTSYINSGGANRGNDDISFTSFPIPDITQPYTIMAEITYLTPDLLNPNPAVAIDVDDGSNANRLSVFRRVTGVQLARSVNSTNSIEDGDLGLDVWPALTRGRIIAGTKPGEQNECFNGGAVSKGHIAMPLALTTARIGRGFQSITAHAGSAVVHKVGIAFRYLSDSDIKYHSTL